MRKSKGFIFIYELISILFTLILLISGAQNFILCWKSLNNNLQLEEAWQELQRVTVGKEMSAGFFVKKQIVQNNDLLLTEVSIYASKDKKILCNIFQGGEEE